MLKNIRIVLVEPSHPGNIGGAARAMKNMGLEQLTLVSPQSFPDENASARAAGADDILASAVIVDNLQTAIHDCTWVYASSARLRSLSWPQFSPYEAASKIVAESHDSKVAVVFGRERTGLSNAELDLCQYLIHIPTNEQFSSLNLAAAVQVICYEIFSSEHSNIAASEKNTEEKLVSQEEMQRFYDHLESVLIAIDFMDPAQPKKLMRRMRRLFNRSQITEIEMNILRGILTAVGKQADRQV